MKEEKLQRKRNCDGREAMIEATTTERLVTREGMMEETATEEEVNMCWKSEIGDQRKVV